MMQTCKKCNKEFTTPQKLLDHINKRVPCDFKCTNCPFQGTSRQQFYRHRKSGCIQLQRSEDEKQIVSNNVDHFPIPISDITDPSLLRKAIEYATENNCEVVIEQTIVTQKITVKGGHCVDDTRNRILRVTENIRDSDVNRALRCLEKSDREELVPFVVDNLTQIHGNYDRKDLHSIKMTDRSRKNVNICTRQDDTCKWMKLPRHEAVSQVSAHSSKLLSSFLNEIIPKLSKCVQKHGAEIRPCLALFDPSKKDDPTFEASGFIVYEVDADPHGLLSMFTSEKIPPNLRVSYESRIKYCHIQIQVLDDLYDLVQQRKDEIVEMLKELVLTEKELTPFLQRTCAFM